MQKPKKKRTDFIYRYKFLQYCSSAFQRFNCKKPKDSITNVPKYTMSQKKIRCKGANTHAILHKAVNPSRPLQPSGPPKHKSDR